MAIVPDQSILDALNGYVTESTKQPLPRLIKIYLSSAKHGKAFACLCLKIQFSLILLLHFMLRHWFNNMMLFDVCTYFLHTEFKEERKVLLEVIGPELQSIYDDRQIEVTQSEYLNKLHLLTLFYSPFRLSLSICILALVWITRLSI
jgi:hypothetical protein